MKKFSSLFFVVLRRIHTIVVAVESSEIENVELGVDFFQVNWGVYTIFLASVLILLT